MNTNSRTRNSTLNFIINIIYQILATALAFVSRRVFVGTLGVEYLGLNGLFNNILSVLSLSELGISGAMIYCMYKEIANNNKNKLSALTYYYRLLYNRIALFILLVGLAIMPFLSFIVNTENEIQNLYIYYLITLLGTAGSYLFIYKTSIVEADQKGYKIKFLSMISNLFIVVLQIVVLKIWHDYLLYILVPFIFGTISNLVYAKVSEKLYPFIKKKEELSKEEKKAIWSNIKSFFVYKIGGTLFYHTDNIIISVMIGTNYVGYYSNYAMITNKIDAFTSMFFNSIRNSLGNFNAKANEKEQYNFFKTINFLAYWILAFSTIGIFFCSDDVIRIMTASGTYVLGFPILVAVTLNFYLKVLKSAVALYRETTGLFKMSKYSILISAILNVVLSIILGYYWGLFGVIIASVISRVVCDVWYEPYTLYKKIFNKNPMEFFIGQFKNIVLTVAIILIMYPVIELVSLDNLYFRTIIKVIICVIIPNFVFFVLFRKKDEFIFIKEKILYVIKGILNTMKGIKNEKLNSGTD